MRGDLKIAGKGCVIAPGPAARREIRDLRSPCNIISTPYNIMRNTVFIFILDTILNAWSETCQHRIYFGNGAESAASLSRSSRQCVPRLGSVARTSRDLPKEINMYHVRQKRTKGTLGIMLATFPYRSTLCKVYRSLGGFEIFLWSAINILYPD